MTRIKRILSMLLVWCTILGLLPNIALAVDGTATFGDVQESDWFYDDVNYVFTHNLMNGTSSTTFAPQETTTRAMIVTILHRLEGTPSASNAGFSDVMVGQYFTKAVDWAAEKNIVNGYGNGKFGPNDDITREQMAAILYRYAKYKDYDVTKKADCSTFSDADQISDYATDALAWCNAVGLIDGMGNNMLAPKGNAIRAQVAAILTRFCEKIVPSTQQGAEQEDLIEPKTHTVTFHLNYGKNEIYQIEKVSEGETITKPSDPIRFGYNFKGWYSTKIGGTIFNFDSTIMKDITLYARWATKSSGGSSGGSSSSVGNNNASDVPDYGNNGNDSGNIGDGSENYDTNYSISEVSVNRNQIVVTLNTDNACILKVQLLDDAGEQVLDHVSTPVAKELELENVTTTLNVMPPQYFQIKAFLEGDNGTKLCTSFTCMKYTSAYAQFDAATINDFGDQIVVNFDEKNDDNFGVLVEDAVQINSTDTNNSVYQIDEDTYTFTNIDNQFDNLKNGDIVAVFKAGELQNVIKIDQLTSQDGNAVIDEDTDATLVDLYDYLKVDMVLEANETEVDMSEVSDGVTLLSEDEQTTRYTRSLNPRIEGDASIGNKVKFGLKIKGKHAEMNGQLELAFKVKAKFEWAPKLFKKDYFYAKLTASNSSTLSAEMKAFLTSQGDDNVQPDKEKSEIRLGRLKFPTKIGDFTIEVKVPLSWKMSGEAKLKKATDSQVGIVYSTTDGSHTFQKKNVDVTFSADAAGEVDIALNPTLNGKFLKVINLSIGPKIGMKATAKRTWIDASDNQESIHACQTVWMAM